jgi:hypothetical protein
MAKRQMTQDLQALEEDLASELQPPARQTICDKLHQEIHCIRDWSSFRIAANIREWIATAAFGQSVPPTVSKGKRLRLLSAIAVPEAKLIFSAA